jgi:hypothetical protein
MIGPLLFFGVKVGFQTLVWQNQSKLLTLFPTTKEQPVSWSKETLQVFAQRTCKV